MAKNYTLLFTHPSGATVTFIYENGELSTLSKGLTTTQFWLSKHVKAHLMRNDKDDIDIACRMMESLGFSEQLTGPLPDLLASTEEVADLKEA